jgi:RIO kinase 1
LSSFNLTDDQPFEEPPYSTWDVAQHGPAPYPDWVITDRNALDTELGILKTGKEADVHLVQRWVPDDPSQNVVMAAKRYRGHDRRLFHRDAGYLEGRRVRRSRETRAMGRRTEFGKSVIAGQWAMTEFDVLGKLWAMDLPVPYPVQLAETEIIMEFVGSAGAAAPRLAQTRPEPAMLPELFEQLRETMSRLALHGWAHGDLSPYNVLLEGEGDPARLVLIDWPQVVDVIGNPHGPEFLERDTHNMCDWFTRRGYAVDEGLLFGDLIAAATSRW